MAITSVRSTAVVGQYSTLSDVGVPDAKVLFEDLSARVLRKRIGEYDALRSFAAGQVGGDVLVDLILGEGDAVVGHDDRDDGFDPFRVWHNEYSDRGDPSAISGSGTQMARGLSTKPDNRC